MVTLRPSSAELREAVVDAAASLVARHGFDGVSVQAVADATGYSKTGILHKFGSKDALMDAVVMSCDSYLDQVADELAGAEPQENLRAVLDGLLRLGVDRPGIVALLLSCPLRSELWPRLDHAAAVILRWFGLQGDDADDGQMIRATACLGGLALVTLTMPAVREAAGRAIAVDAALAAWEGSGSGDA